MNKVDISKLTKIPFNSSQSDLVKYNGEDFEIIRELDMETEYDFEGIYMFEIKFSNGDIIQVFDDEIVKNFFIYNVCGEQFNDDFLAIDGGEHICQKCFDNN